MLSNPQNQPASMEGAHQKAPSVGVGGEPQRFSAKRKVAIVLRLLRGEDLELLSRECKVPASRIAGWRDAFLEAGATAMKRRDEHNPEVARLNAKIGEQAMENELLREKIARMESGRPLPRRRSRP